MTRQLELLGQVPVEPDTRLTERQRYALELIGRTGPIPSDELGAYLHQYRMEHGGKGHSHDTRCSYCSNEGAQMGRALRAKGDPPLVKQRRGEGWITTTDLAARDADASFGDFPQGF